MKITKEESWSRDALYTLCNKEKWYTGGSNEEYEALLSMPDEMEPTDSNIFLAARDIAEHSRRSCHCVSGRKRKSPMRRHSSGKV